MVYQQCTTLTGNAPKDSRGAGSGCEKNSFGLLRNNNDDIINTTTKATKTTEIKSCPQLSLLSLKETDMTYEELEILIKNDEHR